MRSVLRVSRLCAGARESRGRARRQEFRAIVRPFETRECVRRRGFRGSARPCETCGRAWRRGFRNDLKTLKASGFGAD
eukprot:6192561-Pyramimonas_sp.AAC.1